MILFCLWLFVTLNVVEFTISYNQRDYRPTTGNEVLISKTLRITLLDVPEGIFCYFRCNFHISIHKKITERKCIFVGAFFGELLINEIHINLH